MVIFLGAYGSLPDAAIWWCLRTGGGGVVLTRNPSPTLTKLGVFITISVGLENWRDGAKQSETRNNARAEKVFMVVGVLYISY